jgi:hypothetical protein
VSVMSGWLGDVIVESHYAAYVLSVRKLAVLPVRRERGVCWVT